MGFVPANPDVRERLFMAVKYLTYGWLTYNGYLFWASESLAANVTFHGAMSLSELIEVYSATIDTMFWIMLVVLLELETYILDDDVLKKTWVKWTMIALRSLCYGMIIYAFYGYVIKVMFQSNIVPFAVAQAGKGACDLVGHGYSILLALEEYIPLTAETCQTLDGQALGQLNGYAIIGRVEDLTYARNVAWIDIFNASSWLGVVAVLEIDVWFQLRGLYKGRLLQISKVLKVVFYSILFVCAIAWGFTGVFLDFADAALWLFAFFFIEMNLIQWQQTTEEEVMLTASSGSTETD